jgi:hypothetical protein
LSLGYNSGIKTALAVIIRCFLKQKNLIVSLPIVSGVFGLNKIEIIAALAAINTINGLIAAAAV